MFPIALFYGPKSQSGRSFPSGWLRFIPYQNGRYFNAQPNNTFILEADGRKYTFDARGKRLQFPGPQVIYGLVNGFYDNALVFLIQTEQLHGLFNATDNVMIKPQYDAIYSIGDDRFRVKKDNRSFVINKFGEEID